MAQYKYFTFHFFLLSVGAFAYHLHEEYLLEEEVRRDGLAGGKHGILCIPMLLFKIRCRFYYSSFPSHKTHMVHTHVPPPTHRYIREVYTCLGFLGPQLGSKESRGTT